MRTLVKTVAGSHLFGTNTPKSDKDYKGIYIPDAKDIILQRIKPTVDFNTNKTNTKNTSTDIDSTLFSACKFFKMLEKGETVALELLFTPRQFILDKDIMWDRIVKQRDHFLHRGTLSFIGYAKTQANKYGIKGSRMGAIKKVLEALSSIKKYKILKEIESDLDKLIDNDLIKWTYITTTQGELKYFEVCSRKFQHDISVEDMINVLNSIYDNYGERAKLAELNQGIDWKAVSHAFRVCFQGQELFRTGHITLPLIEDQRTLVLKIKNGEMDFNYCSAMLDMELIKLQEAANNSPLPDVPNTKLIEDIIYNLYAEVVIESVY